MASPLGIETNLKIKKALNSDELMLFYAKNVWQDQKISSDKLLELIEEMKSYN